MTSDDTTNNPFSLIADFEGDISKIFDRDIAPVLPVLPLRNMVLFPGVVASVTIGRESSRALVEQVAKRDGLLAVVSQIDNSVEDPGQQDLLTEGVAARVMRVIKMPGGAMSAILQSYGPLSVGTPTRKRPYLRMNVEKLHDELPEEDDEEFNAIADAVREKTMRLLSYNEETRMDASFAVKNISHPVYLINFVATNLPFELEEKAAMLNERSLKKRAEILLGVLARHCEYSELKKDIERRTHEDMDRQQKEYFLQQQIKSIQSELGENGNNDIAEIKAKAANLCFPEKVELAFNRELSRLEHINPQSPDYNVQLNYLQTVVSLPWGVTTEDNLDIANAEKVLNRDHYGMEKVKERILEYLASLRYRTKGTAPILCLYGPPGVGKTSLGKSIAEALGRKYVRISLGGVHDEAEVRGHRRTYVGAMPGRIIKGVAKAESSNPLFVLDEIDKVSVNNYNGDPQSALLEVLDPEQNNAFHDNYLDLDYDLSNVFFVATANNLQTIPAPLLDRMELIEVEGYLTEEKKEIARRHLIPKEQKAFDFGNGERIKFSAPAVETIIEKYTRESGVRQLEKLINKVFRKIAYKKALADGGETPFTANAIKPADVADLLGKPIFSRDKYQGNNYAGVVTGLAWTAVGGEILFIETSLSRSKGPKLTITGNLGDVMKESAVLALEYIKAHADSLGIDYRIFDHWGVHVHVPEGATPKDGPSAGITIATSLASALTQRKVRDHVAMTGEITLRGKVLPVGGIKEKILAAKRAGITDILISEDNKKDVEDISRQYLTGLTFHFVSDVQDVLRIALLDEKVDGALTLDAPEILNEPGDAPVKAEKDNSDVQARLLKAHHQALNA